MLRTRGHPGAPGSVEAIASRNRSQKSKQSHETLRATSEIVKAVDEFKGGFPPEHPDLWIQIRFRGSQIVQRIGPFRFQDESPRDFQKVGSTDELLNWIMEISEGNNNEQFIKHGTKDFREVEAYQHSKLSSFSKNPKKADFENARLRFMELRDQIGIMRSILMPLRTGNFYTSLYKHSKRVDFENARLISAQLRTKITLMNSFLMLFRPGRFYPSWKLISIAEKVLGSTKGLNYIRLSWQRLRHVLLLMKRLIDAVENDTTYSNGYVLYHELMCQLVKELVFILEEDHAYFSQVLLRPATRMGVWAAGPSKSEETTSIEWTVMRYKPSTHRRQEDYADKIERAGTPLLISQEEEEEVERDQTNVFDEEGMKLGVFGRPRWSRRRNQRRKIGGCRAKDWEHFPDVGSHDTRPPRCPNANSRRKRQRFGLVRRLRRKEGNLKSLTKTFVRDHEEMAQFDAKSGDTDEYWRYSDLPPSLPWPLDVENIQSYHRLVRATASGSKPENFPLSFHRPGELLCYPYRLMQHLRTEPHGEVYDMEDLESGRRYQAKVYTLHGIHPSQKKHRVDNLKKLTKLPSFVLSFDCAAQKICLFRHHELQKVTISYELGAIGRRNTPEYKDAFPSLAPRECPVSTGNQSKPATRNLKVAPKPSSSTPSWEALSDARESKTVQGKLGGTPNRWQAAPKELALALRIADKSSELDLAWKDGAEMFLDEPRLESQAGVSLQKKSKRRRRKR